jgi:hypothetical protein
MCGIGWASQQIHDALWPHGPSQSLCARAWEHRDDHWLWSVWVVVFTARHCRAAYQHHRRNRHAA